MEPAVAIQLTRPQVAVGDTVGATVRVVRDEPRALGLELFAEYGGNRVPKTAIGLVRVAHGPLRAGQSYSLAVDLPNDAPFTFQGKELSVEWNVVARVDMPWAIDPRVTEPVHVVPRAVDGSAAAIEAATQVPPKPDKKQGVLGKVLVWLLVGTLALLASFVLLPIVLWLVARNKLLATRLSDFTVEIPEGHYVLGQWVPVTVRFRLKRPIEVVRLSLRFEGAETWRTGSGNSSRTHTEYFVEHEQTAMENTIVTLAPDGGGGGTGGGSVYRSMGRPRSSEPVFEWHTVVQLPHDGLPTVLGGVFYKLRAKAELPGWPDPEAETNIPTVGATLTTKPAQPEHSPPEETSGALGFYGKGQRLPSGVVVAPKGRVAWEWVLTPTVGFGVTLGGLLNLIDRPITLWIAMTVVGAMMLLGGLIGFYVRLFR